MAKVNKQTNTERAQHQPQTTIRANNYAIPLESVATIYRMSLPSTSLRLYQTSQCFDQSWDTLSITLGLKVIVVAVLVNSDEDLIISSALMDLTAEQLRDMTSIEVRRDTKIIHDVSYGITTVNIDFPNYVFKSQGYTIMTNGKKTLVLSRSSTKLDSLLIHWLSNEYGFQLRPLKFNSEFLMDCLNTIVDRLPDKAKLGNVELVFQTELRSKMLNTIAVELRNKDLIGFNEFKTTTLFQEILAYLQDQTSISFHKLKISKFRCRFMMMGSDGRLRFSKGMPMLGSTDEIQFSAWDFIHRICQHL
jgi:hypothetical protein